HSPTPWSETRLKLIGSIAAFAAAGDLDGNPVGVCEGPVAVRAKVPVMIDGRIQIARSKDRREAIDRLVGREGVVRSFPGLIPFFFERQFKPVTGLLHLMIDPAELHRERHGMNPIEEIEPD